MEGIRNILHRFGDKYNEKPESLLKLFEDALYKQEDEIVSSLLFSGSPILSAIDPCQRNALHMICEVHHSNTNLIQTLIDLGINIDAQDKFGATPLHLASKDAFSVLLKNGAKRDIYNKEGLTPIQVAFVSGNLEVVEEFLKEDKLPNILDLDKPERYQHLIKFLLKESDDFYISDTKYSTLAHFLFIMDDEETFEYVVNKTEFDVDAIDLHSKLKYTLLHHVAEYGTPRMVKALIDKGADINAYDLHHNTPLSIAVINSRAVIVQCLFDCGASGSDFIYNSKTLLHYAITKKRFEIVEILLKNGADPNHLSENRWPLLIALDEITDDTLKFLRVLLEHGADVNVKIAKDRTALDQSCRCAKLKIVELLLDFGAEINKANVSTLHHAITGNNPAIVRRILEEGANVSYECAPGKLMYNFFDYNYQSSRTPLQYAITFIRCYSNCEDTIDILLEYGADVNLADTARMETPLHLACLSSAPYALVTEKYLSSVAVIIKRLLRYNANIDALDKNGRTPLFYAISSYRYIQNRSEKCSPFKLPLGILIALIAQRMAKKVWVSEENLKLLEEESTRPIYQICQQEINLMQKNIYESRNFSFLNILTKDIDVLGGVLLNEDLVQVLEAGDYKKKFPIYGEDLEKRLQESKLRQALVEMGVSLLRKNIKKNISFEVVLDIFKCLNLKDLENFAEACFANVPTA